MDNAPKTQPKPRGRRWMRGALRWTVRLLGAAVVLGLLALGVALALLHTDWGRAKALTIALEQTNGSIQGHVEVERLEGSPFGTLSLVGVTVSTPDGEVVATLDELAVSVDLLPLWRDHVEVSSLVATRPWVRVFDATGAVGLARAFAPSQVQAAPAGPSAWTIHLARAELVDGAVELDATSRIRALPGIEPSRSVPAGVPEQSPAATELQVVVEVELDLDGVHWRNLVVDTALGALPSEHLHLTHSGALVDKRLLIEDLVVDLDWAHLEADGAVDLDLSERSTLDLRDLTVNLGAMRSALAGTGVALPPQVQGNAQLTAALEGSLDALHLQLHTRTPWGRVALDGHVDLHSLTYDLAVAAHDVELSPWLARPVPPLQLSLTARGTQNPTHRGLATVQGWLAADDSTLPMHRLAFSAELRDGMGKARVDIPLDDDGQFELDTTSLLFTQTAADPVFSSPLEVAVRANGQGLDLTPILALAGLSEASGEVGFDVDGVLHYSAASGLSASADLGLRVRALALEGLGASLDQGELRGALQWDPKRGPAGELDLDLTGASALGFGVERLSVGLAVTQATTPSSELRLTLAAAQIDLGPLGSIGAVHGSAEGEAADWTQLPTGRLKLDVSELRVGPMTAPSAALTAALTRWEPEPEGSLTVSVPRLSGFGATLRGVQLSGEGSQHTDGRITAALDLQLESAVMAAQGIGATNAHITLTASPSQQDLDAAVRATVKDLDGGPDLKAKTAGINGKARIRAGVVSSADFSVLLGDGLLFGRALTTATVDGRLQDAQSLRLSVDAQGADSALQADVAVRFGPHLQATLNALNLTAAGAGFQIDPGAHLALRPGGGLDLRAFSLRGTGENTGAVRVDAASWEPKRQTFSLQAEAEKVDLAQWSQSIEALLSMDVLPDLKGELSLNAHIARSSRESPPLGTLTLNATGLGVGEWVQGANVNIDLAIDAQNATLVADAKLGELATVQVAWKAPTSQFPLSAVAVKEMARETPLNLTAHLEISSVAALLATLPVANRPSLPPSAEASVACDLELHGTLGQPEGDVSVGLSGVTMAGMAPLGLEVKSHFQPSGMGVEGHLSDQEGELVSLTAQLPVNLGDFLFAPQDATQRLLTESSSLALHTPLLEVGRLPGGEELPWWLHKAELELDLEGSGPLKQLQFRGTQTAKLALGEEQLEARLELVSTDGNLHGELVAVTQTARWVYATVDVNSFYEVFGGEDVLAAFLQDPANTATLHLDFPSDGIAAFCAEIGLSCSQSVRPPYVVADVHYLHGSDGPVAQLDLTATMARESALAPALEAVRLSGHVDAHTAHADLALAPMEAGEELQASFDADWGFSSLGASTSPTVTAKLTSAGFDLTPLFKLWPKVFGQSKAILVADAQLSTATGTPRVTGSLGVHFAPLDNTLLGTKVATQNIDLRLDGNRLVLDELTLTDNDGGTLVANLEVAADGLALDTIHLTGDVQARHYEAVARKDVKGRLSAALVVSGTLAKPTVTGTLSLDDLLIEPQNLDRPLGQTGPIRDVYFTTPGDRPFQYDVYLESTLNPRPSTPGIRPSVKVQVTLPPRRVRIQNEMANITGTGQLDVVLADTVLRVTGEIDLTGTVNLYGREFVLAEGSNVVLDGAAVIDPILDVTAEFDISEVDLSSVGLQTTPESRIRVLVSGRASDPKLKLSSDLGLDETQMISVVSMGSLGGGSDPKDFENQATSVFAGLATGTLGKALANELDLDVLEVGTSDTSASAARIITGKHLTKDLTLFYRANIGARDRQNTNEIALTWFITRFLSLESHYGDEGQGAIDLLLGWKW